MTQRPLVYLEVTPGIIMQRFHLMRTDLKYLFYHPQEAAGLLHVESQLKTVCREAAWLGRAPVFPKPAPLAVRHNFLIAPNTPCSKYWDTEHIDVQYCEDANAQPLEISLSAIDEEQLRGMDIPQQETLEISAGEPITAAQNERLRLIIRRMDPRVMHRLQQALLLAESFAHGPPPAKNLPQGKAMKVLRVTLRPSREVRTLAQEVIRQLPPDYCVAHVRRGDLLKIPAFRAWTSPDAVVQALKKADVAANATVYLMSDERSRRWRAAIRKQRSILHHTDFPHLAELIQPPGAIDNYFLFAVEREILRRAAKKLLPWRKSAEHQAVCLAPSGLSPNLFAYYHPAETELGFRAWKWTQGWNGFITPKAKMRLLPPRIARLTKAAVYYSARRLFLPGSLRRFHNKRKALNIP